ncbi:hypothetical protein [Microbulbifer agarilyticus]|uniref:hypothetical protein n=1 Tax=Microbulbifer agarilyticus TaxID=260552 RepID=UPI0012FCDDEB|nr:hypothetical protein [Microbulbifer agarilyticus]
MIYEYIPKVLVFGVGVSSFLILLFIVAFSKPGSRFVIKGSIWHKDAARERIVPEQFEKFWLLVQVQKFSFWGLVGWAFIALLARVVGHT